MSLRTYIKTRHPKLFSTLKSLRSFFSKSMEESNSSAGINDAPPPFDPLVPAIPISYPLKTLEELESRDYFKSFHYPFNKSSVSLNGDLQKRPRILVCHDMAGGYTDDRFVQGGMNSDAYAVWHWYLIDIFVYFSHNLVTLPPPCWTNTAHKHGVKVLGTFIMEWDEGKKRAEKLLSTKESAHMYAERLTELAVALNFDGWLINMEVNLNPKQIPNLIEFVSHLSQTMHSSVPGSTVIWYDSVTVDGALRWQNKLNDKNKPFFDVCDGIFVNYSWREDYPKSSADVAGDRKFDVYMGIDVFGRGTYGGGQWTTNVALDVIKKDEVSAAMFAPGWVYETKQPPDFQTAQNRWWGLVEKSWGVVQNYPKVLPFYSNFNQGHGYHIYIDGEQVSNTPWNNISSQSFQPYIEYTEDPATQPIQVAVDFKDSSYSGGGSIKFKGTLGNDNFAARVFQGKLLLGSSPVIFTYSVQLSGNSLLGLALMFSSTDNEKKSVLLASSGDTLVTFNQFSKHFTNVIMPRQVTEKESGWVIQESSIEMDRHTLREIRALCYRAPSRDPSDYYAVLGDISVKTTSDNTNFPPSTSWEVISQYVQFTSGPQGSKNLSIKIIWKRKFGNVDTFSGYNIYVKKIKNASSENSKVVVEVAEQEYLGVAKVESFYISDLLVPSGTSDLKFIIQVCSVDGASQQLDDSPSLILKVEAA